jgi:ATP-binding cassette, subfamily B (MDR/TAP), member 1
MGLALQYSVTLVVSLGIGLKVSWSLTLTILASLPIIIVVFAISARRIQHRIRLEQSHLSHAASRLICAVAAITTVKAFNAQAEETSRVDTTLNLATTAYPRIAQINGLQQGIVRFLVLAMFVQGFWYGGSLVSNGELEPGSVIVVFWAALMAVSSLQNISTQIVILETGKVASSELALLCPTPVERLEPLKEAGEIGDIEFKNVSPCREITDGWSRSLTVHVRIVLSSTTYRSSSRPKF